MSIDSRYKTTFHYEKGYLLVMLVDELKESQKIIHREPLDDKNSRRARSEGP